MSDIRRWFTAAAVLGLSASLAHAQGPYLISTYAGGLAPPTAAPGLNFAFGFPAAAVTDPFGNTYISTGYNCVFRLDQSGNLSRVAGTCQAGFSGNGGAAVKAQLNNPQGLALDSLGNLYIADQGNQCIRQVTPAGIISTFAGTGTAGYSGDNGPATSAQLKNPQGLAADSAGNLYIADQGNFRIRKVAPNGTITTIAGSSVSVTGGDGGPATAATFVSPNGLVLDSKGDLYISDSGANVVRMINSAGNIVHIAGTGSPGYSEGPQPAASAALNFPQGLAFDLAGNLYIADTDNYRVRVVGVTGVITTYAGSSVFGDSGDGLPATSASLLSPSGVSTDRSGDLYIADSVGVVRKVNASGIISTVAGNGSGPLPFGGDGGAAGLAQFATPWGLARDGAGNLYIADWKDSRVRKVNSSGVISTFAGNGTAPDSGDGGPATSASVTPFGVATDSLGNVYLADTALIRKINSSGVISTIAGTGSFGYNGDNISAVSALLGSYLPGIAVDSHQNVYIADYDNQEVRKITAATGTISAVAGNHTLGAGYSGDNAPATSAQLKFPAGLAVDANGNLYIADSGNCVVRMVSASNGNIQTIAGNHTCNSSGDNGPATSAELMTPWALALDGNGNLFIATQANTIRKVSGGTITTIAGTAGAAAYSGDGGLAAAGLLSNPSGLTVDSAGNIYVGDFGNGAVRVLQPETEPLLTVSSTHVGIFPAGLSGSFQIVGADAPLAAAASGAITIKDILPAGVTPVSMGGSGWTCTFSSPAYTCTGAPSALGQGGALTLTVNVPSGGPSQITNEVTISGGGSLGGAAEDSAFIGSSTPVLQISAAHTGDFVAGAAATFSITVGNQISAADTSGTVTVTDTLPSGLSLVSLNGAPDWNCAGSTCTSNIPLAGGANYTPIIGNVNVSSSAGSPLTNTATASGGGSASSPTSHDTIIVLSLSGCEITGNPSVTVADIQAIVNQSLGTSHAANDVNQDGVVNVVDVQIVINAALNLGCTP